MSLSFKTLLISTEEMQWKKRVSRRFAISRSLNLRNTENEWYGCWNQVGLELTAGAPNLILFPQFPAWFGDGDSFQPPSHPIIPPLPKFPPVPSLLDSDHDLSDSDASVSSAATTSLPQRKSSSRYPDFAILNIQTTIVPPGKIHPAIYDHLKITGIEVKVLIEIKRGAGRDLLLANDQGLQVVINSYIVTAQLEILAQAAIVFARYTNVQVLRCIVASGDYWQHTAIRRNNILKATYKSVNLQGFGPEPGEYVKPIWIPRLPVKISESVSELTKIFRELRGTSFS